MCLSMAEKLGTAKAAEIPPSLILPISFDGMKTISYLSESTSTVTVAILRIVVIEDMIDSTKLTSTRIRISGGSLEYSAMFTCSVTQSWAGSKTSQSALYWTIRTKTLPCILSSTYKPEFR